MSEVTIISNYKPRQLFAKVELTEKEAEEFEYVSGEDRHYPRFFRYKGNVYDVNDCEHATSTHPAFRNWDGYFSETYFSGVLFRYVPDTDWEEVVVGRYYT